MYKFLSFVSAAAPIVLAQQVGTNTAENHPSLSVATCTKSGGCSNQSQSIVLDANWRWLHTTAGYTNCYTGQTWDTTICSDAQTCTQNCGLDGADYGGTYGISTTGSSVNLGFVTQGSSQPNIGSRVYLMQDPNNYQIFNLLNGEFTFDVDVSQLPCGLNGAIYFSQMDQDGGMKRFPTNKAGAKYGTGYCDAQCPRDLKFINGVANIDGWTPSPKDKNSGTGNIGSCCSEMDIWEANSFAAAYTPHPCSADSATSCIGTSCSGICDKAGCDFNSWRMSNQTFYGPGLTVDTKSKITVITQFITDDKTNQGNLIQINRFYVQNGKVIPNSLSSTSGVDSVNSISDNFCSQQKIAFSEHNDFAGLGGLKKMGAAFKAGMVLVMSIWDDHDENCLWLDSDYPLASNPRAPGVNRGPCSRSSGLPADLEKNFPNSKVSFSNIKWGELNSTFTGSDTVISGGSGETSSTSSAVESTKISSSATSSVSLPSTSTAPIASTSSTCGFSALFGQCGGQEWTGPTCCQSGSTCKVANQWYSQCL